MMWLCKCDCGKEKVINSYSVRKGKTKSCGCLQKEIVSNGKFAIKHSKKGTKIYNIWQQMIQRCKNPKYKYHCGRGIKVCYKWSNKNPNGFQNFYKDIGDPPKGLSLDRIDNDKGYNPNNWRWATSKEQANNTRSNIIVRFNNKNERLSLLADQYKIKRETLKDRLDAGWPIEKVLITPVKKYKKN